MEILKQLKERVEKQNICRGSYCNDFGYCAIGHLLSIKGMPDNEIKQLDIISPTAFSIINKFISEPMQRNVLSHPALHLTRQQEIDLVAKANQLLCSTNISMDNLENLQHLNDNVPYTTLLNFINDLIEKENENVN